MAKNLTLVALSLATLAEATTEKTLRGNFYVKVTLDPSNSANVIFSITMDKGSWLGLTLGSGGMTPNSDMIQLDADKQEVHDMTSAGYQAPSKDTTKNLSATWSTKGNVKTAVITRKLDTGDAKDYVFQLDKTFTLGWAINTYSSIITSKHNYAGSFQAIIKSSSSKSGSGSKDSGSKDSGSKDSGSKDNSGSKSGSSSVVDKVVGGDKSTSSVVPGATARAYFALGVSATTLLTFLAI